MKDILGNELRIGDMVVCTTSKYEELSIGRIARFTPKKAEVKMKLGPFYTRLKLKDSCQLCKVDCEIPEELL